MQDAAFYAALDADLAAAGARSRNRMSEFFDFQRSSLDLWTGGTIRDAVRLRIEESGLYKNRAADLAVY